MINFLDLNGYRAYTTDLEAILRRFDHSGDQLLSYTEFCELVSLHDAPLSSSIGGGSGSKAGSPNHGPQALRVTNRSSSPLPSHSRLENEQLDRIGTFGPIRQESPKNEEGGEAPLFCGPIGSEKKIKAQEEEEEKGLFCGPIGSERKQVDGPKDNNNSGVAMQEEEESIPQVDENAEPNLPPQEFRFLSVVKNQIRIDKKLEIQKEILVSNNSFNLVEAFRMFDIGNKGYITT